MYIIAMPAGSIPSIAARLTNGSQLIGTDFSVKAIMKKGADISTGAAKRINNSLKRDTF